MSGDTQVIEQLRTARRADDALSHLREGSQEARRDRIASALTHPDFSAGPAELLYTFPHHAVCQRDGIVMRVRVHESKDGEITLGNVEVHEIPDAVPDVVEEVMATARAAVPMILADDADAARPLVAGIANALSVRGDLRRRVQMEMARRTVGRRAWWHSVVRSHLGENTKTDELPLASGSVAEDADALRAFLEHLALETSASLTALSEQTLAPAIESVATSIADDLKYSIQALAGANREDEIELSGAFEGVRAMAENLVLGARFLATLTNETKAPSGAGEE